MFFDRATLLDRVHLIATGMLMISLSACGGGGESGSSSQLSSTSVASTDLTVEQINSLLAQSKYHGSNTQMTCSGSAVSGCFVIPGCNRSSDYYSTRMVYSVETSTIEAFMVSYDSPNCTGQPHLHPTVWSQWNYVLQNYQNDTRKGELAVTLIRYDDGYLFDTSKPVLNTMYKSAIGLSNADGTLKLCLSTPLIDPSRPLKFMSTTAQPLDTSNCAVQLF